MTTLAVKNPVSPLWEFYGFDGSAYVIKRAPVSQDITVPAGQYGQVVISSLDDQGMEVRGHYIGDLALTAPGYTFNAATNALTPVRQPPVPQPGVNWTVLLLLAIVLVADSGQRQG